MHSILELEHKRKLTFFALILITVSILAVSSLRDPYALDSFWHLKTGQDLVEKGLSPYEDHYSINFYGERIESPPVLFQVLLWGVVSVFGITAGYKLIVFVCGVLTLGLMLTWLKQIRAPALVFIVALPMLLILLQQRAMVRPEIFSYPLILISLVLYEKARTGNENRFFPYIVAVMLFWTNYHSSILGYAIFSGLFLDLAIRRIQEKSPWSHWTTWLGWGILLLAVGFINPSMSHPVLNTFAFDKEWAGVIHEYRASFKGSVTVTTLLLTFVTLFNFFLLIKFRLIGYLAVCIIFAWTAVSMIRMVTPAGIVILSIFALALTQINWKSLRTHRNKKRFYFLIAGLWTIGIGSIIIGILTARQLISTNQFLLGNFPNQMVKYMRESGKHGRILNDYSLGGYLIYHLGDHSRVYIDGRTGILYPFEHHQKWLDATSNPNILRNEIERNQIDYVLLGHRQEFVDLVNIAGGMQLDYSDLRYSLYARENANFPLAGSLWSDPWCWEDFIIEPLMKEHSIAKQLLPPYSPLIHLISLAESYASAKNKSKHLEYLSNNNHIVWYESSLRFVGYRALEIGEFNLAKKWFSQIENLTLKDYLASAMASLNIGNIDEAEIILANAIRIDWPLPIFNDYRILQALFSEMSSKKILAEEESQFLRELTLTVGPNAIPYADLPISSFDFCTNPKLIPSGNN